jgi:hypothetical protein
MLMTHTTGLINKVKEDLNEYRYCAGHQSELFESPIARMAVEHLESLVVVIEWHIEYIGETKPVKKQYLLDYLYQANEFTREILRRGNNFNLSEATING